MIRKGSGKGGNSRSDSSAEAAARLADYTGERSALAGHASLGAGAGLPGSPEGDGGASASPSSSPGAGTQYQVTDLAAGMEALTTSQTCTSGKDTPTLKVTTSEYEFNPTPNHFDTLSPIILFF